jgi:epoxyqueuosine reductase QueG
MRDECFMQLSTDVHTRAKNLTEEIRSIGLSNGADLVGFAPTASFEELAPMGHKPTELMSDAKSIVILACGRRLNEDRHYFYKWGPHFSLTYIRLKDELRQLRAEARNSIQAVKDFLVTKGYEAVTEPHGWSGILSFKKALELSGLGVFGKGSFIIHPTLGPLNTIACILTDADLAYGSPLEKDLCGSCTECIKACKYGAFRVKDDRFEWIGEKCRCYDLIMNPVTLKWTYGPCNSKCVHACPIGK